MNENWKTLHWKVQHNNLLENQILMFRLTLKLSQHLNFWPNFTAPSMNGHLKKILQVLNIRLSTFGDLEKLLTQNRVHKWVQRGSRYQRSLWEGFGQNVPFIYLLLVWLQFHGSRGQLWELNSWSVVYRGPYLFLQSSTASFSLFQGTSRLITITYHMHNSAPYCIYAANVRT